MGTQSAPSPQEKRFAAYTDCLAKAAGHADRHAPLKAYCAGLLLPGERKRVEPMAARLAPENVQRTHQSLHHLVADAPWSDEAVLGSVREDVLAAMKQNGPVVAWIVDDTGFLKKGTHSVGVARQWMALRRATRLPLMTGENMELAESNIFRRDLRRRKRTDREVSLFCQACNQGRDAWPGTL